MHPVPGLAPDRRARAVDHRRGHFLAAPRRQAMHEPGVRSERHQGLVNLIGLEKGAPLLAVLPAHRDPDVGVDDIGAFHGIPRIGERAFEAVAGRAGDHEFRADERACFGQRARDVVALADKGDARAFEPPQ